MKQKIIQRTINKRFGKIDKLFGRIIKGFEVEPVHDFRTEIKKLRAFFRLLNVEIDDSSGLKVPKDLKIFYSYTGTIRNLQLQFDNIKAYVNNRGYNNVSGIYAEYLEKIIEKWKADIIQLKRAENDFNSGEEKIINKLPRKLTRASVKFFLQNKIYELECLVKQLPDDDVLHSIRKLLKDLLYNWGFIEQYKKDLPAVCADEEKLKSFTDILGLFLDKGVAINLLETYCRDCEENGVFFEKEIGELHEIENEWKKEKEELTQIIYLKLDLPHLLTAVDPAR